MGTLLIIAEERGGRLRQVSLEAIEAARRMAADGDAVAAALIGGPGTAERAAELAAYGVAAVYAVEHAELTEYRAEAYFAAVRSVLREANPYAVVLGHTAIGRDIGPMLAASLGCGQISDAIAVDKQADGRVVFTRPLYAGKALEQKAFAAGDEPRVVTIRPSNLPAAEKTADAASAQASVVALEYAPPASLRTAVRQVVRQTAGRADLTEARIIVSGGRGVKSAEGFRPLEELAAVLNGAVGASRGACDAGYCDYALQIGQTGKVVTPDIYIACGISGAIQHLAGMSRSRIIIAINKDPEAPIFQTADYGIVGDLFEIVPLLTEEFRKALEHGD